MRSEPSSRILHRNPATLAAMGLVLLVTLAIATFTTGCRMSPPRPEDTHAKPTRPIEQVLHDHSAEIMAIDGVVGLYQAQLDDGRPCLKVMVVKNTRALAAKVPKQLEGYPVQIDETGVIKPLDAR